MVDKNLLDSLNGGITNGRGNDNFRLLLVKVNDAATVNPPRCLRLCSSYQKFKRRPFA